ncbi:hypothetical protein QFZ81_003396 [Paenibacillus sp. V4I9]|nr:hypothetical protein [Paenibacillus sp. V4I9]
MACGAQALGVCSEAEDIGIGGFIACRRESDHS